MTIRSLRRHHKLLAWTGGSLAMLLVALAATGYLAYRHLNSNITQVNLEADLGKQPADLHPQAENIVIIGSGSGNQTGTLMLVHVAADHQWAEIMFIPAYSWVSIPSCATPDGRLSAPVQSEISQAYTTGNQDVIHVALGAACTIRTIEGDTGIYVDHFIVVNYSSFEGMVAALGGVEERNQTAIGSPRAGFVLPPGRRQLTPAQALAYVHSLFGPEASSDQARITLQESVAESLVARARNQLTDPLATYRFLNSFTRSLTIDSQLGGLDGLYHLAEILHGIVAGNITLFALPSYPRADVVPSDTKDVLWTQPGDSQIFASFRNDVPASHTALAASAGQR